MKYHVYIFVFFIQSIFTLLYLPAAEIIEPIHIGSIERVLDIFAHITDRDFVVCDIDNTLMESSEPIEQTRFLKNQALQNNKEEFADRLKKNFLREEYNQFLLQRKLQTKPQPVESRFIAEINKLIDRTVPVISLTYRTSGIPLTMNLKSENFTYQQLRDIGIDLSQSFAMDNQYLDDLVNNDMTSPLFHNGIIFCNSFQKGLVLKSFIKKTGWNPKTIFFFDDDEANAILVANEMAGMGFECHTYIYEAAQITNTTNSFNMDVIQYQHQLMLGQKKYISYADAATLLSESQNK
jgi:hypothetical protein